ncbi:hypothetical protein FGG08_001692 [Glutinoglossum americanum]|uniref:Nuclear pore complex protein Nup160 n=1 Tax=Glutinoglossum americanum TaxID=1670608 RepID=A0A9P8IAS7_9PEZI|nr:hypothetical protein FGG08_001692 [Glutinoglossum americanum]
MADQAPFYLFKELRLNLEPAYPDSIITVRLPPIGQPSRASQRRVKPSELSPAEDEGAFAKKCLATSSSIYFRRNKKYPRSFLWRVLDEGKTLSIQSVDLSKSTKPTVDASLILRLVFPNAIRPAGVVLSDSKEHEYFNVFALTSSNDLYTFTLRPEFFTRASAIDGDVSFWYKTFLPSSFSFRYPHRLAALSPRELLISLHDGGLLRLSRKQEDDGSFWAESFLNDGGWGSSFRSLLPWQGSNTIRYGNIRLEQTTPTSLALSPDKSYLFTISLNHTLKAWNLVNGRIDVSKDLLNEERQPQDTSKFLLDPSETDLIAVINRQMRPDDLFYVLTYSPIGAGQFKFWAAIKDTNGQLELEDICPDTVLEPPTPSTEIWTLAQFKVASTPQTERISLWILWKNNTSYCVQNLEFDLRTIPIEWNDEFWVTAATETIRDQLLPEPSEFESKDSTDKWVEYLFYPERFTKATLETSLSIYEHSFRALKDRASFKGKALEERLCSSIAATVALNRDSDGNVDFEQYRSDVDSQWRRFYRIAAELDKQRGEAVSLVFDKYSDLPFVVATDGVTLIRDCSGTELLYHNRTNQSYHEDILQFRGSGKLLHNKLKKDPKDIAGLVNAACIFRETFSNRLLHTCLATAEFEALRESSYSVPDRIQSFYDRCGFDGQVSDDDYSRLITALDVFGGLKALDTNLFVAVIDSIPYQVRKPREGLPLTTFGGKTLVVGAQELINLHSIILFDLLILIVFLEIEVDREEEPMEWFDAGSLYFKIIGMLRDHDVLKWLARSSRLQVPTPTGEDLETSLKHLEVSKLRQDGRRATVLQDLFVDYMDLPVARTDQTQPYLLTASLRNTFYRVFEPEGQKSYSSVTLILCNLLKTQNTGLASEFVRYLPNTPWATYLRGRVHLCKREYSMAAACFKKSAYGLHSLSLDKDKMTDEDTDGLLDLVGLRDLHDGPLGFYRHIVGLFEGERTYSYAVDFAKVAIQFAVLARADEPTGNVMDDILNRLFYSSLQTSRFDEAYSAISQMGDNTLKKRAIRDLVAFMCERGDSEELISLPFIGLQDEVDEQLVFHCQNTLSINSGPPFHKVLFAWRMKRCDFRGAASILYERLQRLQAASTASKDSQNTPVTQGYLTLIDILSSVDPAQAWILTSTRVVDEAAIAKRAKTISGNTATLKRKVVTIDDIRKEYQKELDRIAKIESNQFSFIGGMEEDVL